MGQSPPNRRDAELQSFTFDENGKICRRVCDDETHRLLEEIRDTVDGSIPTTATFYEVTTTATVESSQALPANCRGYIIKCKGNSRIDFAHTTGAANTWTVWPGAEHNDDHFYTGLTLYFTTSKNDTVEIIAYT